MTDLDIHEPGTVDTQVRDAFDLYIEAWLAGVAKSPHTERAYRLDMRQWREHLATAGCPPLAARRAHVDTWMQDMQAGDAEHPPRSDATIARKVSTVASLYDYLVGEEVLEKSPTARVDRPKVDPEHSDTIALTPDESQAAVHAARREGVWAELAVEILLTTGLRSAELISCRVQDIGHEKGYTTLTVTRKGRRRDRVPLHPRVADLLRAHLDSRDVGPLILLPTGKPLDYPALQRLTRRLGRAHGVPDDVTPHCLRATYATIALDKGATLADVQDAMGHRRADTTRVYDKRRGKVERVARASYLVAQSVLPLDA